MTNEKTQDKCRGSLIGGAVGDALGYEVEFMSLQSIRKRFGEEGIGDYVLNHHGVAEFSDDTQMSLFTAHGLLCCAQDGHLFHDDMTHYLRRSYIDWYYTQSRPMSKMKHNWLLGLRALWSQRAPGNTCLSALATVRKSDFMPVINMSKGCGGVMRVAPIAVYSAAHPRLLNLQYATFLAGAAAEITHKHPLSTYSSMALGAIVAECIDHSEVDRDKFRFIVMQRVFKLMSMWFGMDEYLSELEALMEKALTLAEEDLPDTDAIALLGEGWVAEETLAIALFCVMRYIDDFSKCICCAVNHSGDSDSTGAVAGNIIGAIVGYDAIPKKFLTALELHDVVLSVADDLAGISDERQMKERYADHLPCNVDKRLLIWG